MNVNGKLSKKFEGLFFYTKSSPERIVQGSLTISQLYYLVKLKALRIAGNQLVVDSFAQSFKNGNVVFTVNVAVDTVLHTVPQHQISKAGVLRARKERRIVKGRNYLLCLHFMCLLQ